jgi:hypothetical protein
MIKSTLFILEKKLLNGVKVARGLQEYGKGDYDHLKRLKYGMGMR